MWVAEVTESDQTVARSFFREFGFNDTAEIFKKGPSRPFDVISTTKRTKDAEETRKRQAIKSGVVCVQA